MRETIYVEKKTVSRRLFCGAPAPQPIPRGPNPSHRAPPPAPTTAALVLLSTASATTVGAAASAHYCRHSSSPALAGKSPCATLGPLFYTRAHLKWGGRIPRQSKTDGIHSTITNVESPTTMKQPVEIYNNCAICMIMNNAQHVYTPLLIKK